jgi:hypothetical protein
VESQLGSNADFAEVNVHHVREAVVIELRAELAITAADDKETSAVRGRVIGVCVSGCSHQRPQLLPVAVPLERFRAALDVGASYCDTGGHQGSA